MVAIKKSEYLSANSVIKANHASGMSVSFMVTVKNRNCTMKAEPSQEELAGGAGAGSLLQPGSCGSTEGRFPQSEQWLLDLCPT